MRAIAAVLVVLVHAINSNDFRTDLPRSWLGSPAAGYFNNLGACGVDMFFVVSGFVMAHALGAPSAKSARAFAVNRLLRIVPYYWVATILFFVSMSLTGRHFDFEQGVTSLTIFPLYNPSEFAPPILFVGWTLAFELAFYGVVALSIHVEPNHVRRRRLVCEAVCFIGLASWCLGTPQIDLFALLFNPIWLEFALGLCAYALWRRQPEASVSVALLTLAAGFAGFSVSVIHGFPFHDVHWGILNEGAGIKRVVWWALPSTALLFGLLWLSAGARWLTASPGWRLTRRIGDASYSLYLLHLGVIFLYEDIAPTNVLDPDLVIFAMLVVNVCLALAAYRWVEKPLLDWSRAKFDRIQLMGRRVSPA